MELLSGEGLAKLMQWRRACWSKVEQLRVAEEGVKLSAVRLELELLPRSEYDLGLAHEKI